MKEFTFEEAYTRLEEILEKLNSGKATLDESLKLYEEADHLISSCQKRLHSAEQKIEILLKNRQNELAIDTEGKPVTQPFISTSSSS